jgi:hypothetical protein
VTRPALKIATRSDFPPAPSDLQGSVELWMAVVTGWALDADELVVLAEACRAADRVTQCREIIDEQGLLVDGRYGRRQNPLLGVERDNRIVTSRLLRQLGLKRSPVNRNPLALPARRGRRGA